MDRLDRPAIRVSEYAGGAYILVCPTYADGNGNGAVPGSVIRLLNKHRDSMVGVIGAGNRNFGATYCLASRIISCKTGKPILHNFELSGNDMDIEKVRDIYDHCVHQGKLPPVQDAKAGA